MTRLLFLVVVAGLLIWILSPQWRSFERLGERRFEVLSTPPEQLLIGVCWPFSVNQDGMAEGLELALDEINSRGLAGRVPVRLIVRDDQFNWELAKRIAIEFSSNMQMSAVLGYYDDAVAIKASAIYESNRLLHLIVGANSTPMTTRGFQYIVRTILSSDSIARSLANMTVERGHRKIALIWEEDAYGEDLAYRYRIGLDAHNLQLVYQTSYSRERADFRLMANELRGIDADMIFFAGLEPWAGDFLRTARRVGIKTEILGAFSNTPELRQRAGQGLEGAMYFDEYNVSSATPENQAFVRKFRARFGKDPDTWAVQGYDALHLLAVAFQSTGSANPLDLAYAIRYMDPWQGANGRYKFDSHGELDDKPIYLNAYRNGTPVTIQESRPGLVMPGR